MKKQQFGETLKTLRKQQGLSQQQVCQGICSQPMLSAIEAGKYIPNSQLLIQLCQRLEIQAETLILKEHYAISDNYSFSQKVEQLCNAHHYEELQSFLLQAEVVEQLTSKEQYQAYYYYLGCCAFHLYKDLQACETNFKLSLAEVKNFKRPTSLTRLALFSLALVNAKQQQRQAALEYLSQSLAELEEQIYEPNFNAIFYLNALVLFELTDYLAAAIMIEQGVTYITSRDSHFMLANLFYLLAMTGEKSSLNMQPQEAYDKSSLLEDLFQETVFKKI